MADNFFTEFINAFDPNYEQKKQQAAALATAKSFQDLIAGGQQPFQAELFPGEQPIQGLYNQSQPLIPQSPQRQAIETLLQSQNPQLALSGIQQAQQALADKSKQISAGARQALQQKQIREALSGLPLDNRPGLEALVNLAQVPGMVEKVIPSLKEQLSPFTLGEQRFSGLGTEIAKAAPKLADIDRRRNEQFQKATTLRNQFVGVTKEYEAQNAAYGRIIASAADPSPAGDMALIFNYMKVLDPGSTVREGEFATAAASGSFGDRIQAGVLKVMSGERLTPRQRQDFVDRAGKLFEQASKQHKITAKEFTGLAQRQNIDPSNVVFQRQTVSPLTNQIPPPPGFRR